MVDKQSTLQILGSLMQLPSLLSQTDKYNLTPFDFSSRLDRNIFIAIDTLYRNGAKRIKPIDIENFLNSNQSALALFNQQNGIEYLQDADYLAEPDNFDYYYKHLKKINLLTSLKKMGIDTNQFYCEDFTKEKAFEINQKFEQLQIGDIFTKLKKDILKIEHKFLQNEVTEVKKAFIDIEELIEDSYTQEDVGYPLQGDIFSEVISGARKNMLCIRSGASGTSKTRQAVGDACFLAFPIRYDPITCEWVQTGNNQKVLFIATEQNFKEIQKMILAYLTGFNENKFRYGDYSTSEEKILNQALKVLEKYQDNFYIVKMPNPTIELIKNIIRENCILYNIEYVFYDYIFIGPAILGEFGGFRLRNDEILLMLATALKDLASELDIFVMTSTQVNANADNNQNIKNESALAGSRAIINKADIGAIMARPTNEELNILTSNGLIFQKTPNIVTDIYKVRSGEYNQVRIWSYVDLGNLRKEDLFITDSRLEVLDDFSYNKQLVVDWTSEEWAELNDMINQLNQV